ncbi:DNA polymerase delta subunit 2 [Phlebotomus argentipes]|uniref:DNA polymerase delta subunit 2 n=1 Tax=Phlebotomus argentipes TaxID=94469 RepID=UPI002892C5CC|nr:DNA polymerase delta subunit 2 [Phlebotomus argentipes]
MANFVKQNGANGHGEQEERMTVEYVNRSERFLLPKQLDYNQQFHNLYVARCEAMSGLLRERVALKWGEQYPIRRIHDLSEDDQEKCVIIGTVYKQQTLKPSVLKELSKVTNIVPQPIACDFTDDSDEVMLEDELQRVRLFGNINPHEVVTGIMCAVLGHILEQGRFHVDEILFYECGPQKPLKSLDNSPFLVLLSGLNMTRTDDRFLSLEAFQNWIYGNMPEDKGFDPSSIVRVIVAGNSVRNEDNHADSVDLEQQATSEELNGIKFLDQFLHDLGGSVHVDLMPGEFDPTSSLLPQPPLHPLLLPMSSQLMSCRSVPNPYACEIGGRCILGMSGQNVDDILRYSRISDSLSALKATYRWGHIVPTCPDTKFAYPLQGKDPFVIDECPHIYFAGNCPEYKSELVKENGREVRLICVPKFSKSKSVVVVNLATLDCKLMKF